jgi:hypothetical protein
MLAVVFAVICSALPRKSEPAAYIGDQRKPFVLQDSALRPMVLAAGDGLLQKARPADEGDDPAPRKAAVKAPQLAVASVEEESPPKRVRDRDAPAEGNCRRRTSEGPR